jgi:hypothetical protein
VRVRVWVTGHAHARGGCVLEYLRSRGVIYFNKLCHLGFYKYSKESLEQSLKFNKQ